MSTPGGPSVGCDDGQVLLGAVGVAQAQGS